MTKILEPFGTLWLGWLAAALLTIWLLDVPNVNGFAFAKAMLGVSLPYWLGVATLRLAQREAGRWRP